MKRNKTSTYFMVLNAIIAAIYFTLSMFLMPLTFGEVQFRFSEILTVLPFFNPSLSIGVVIGCLLTNFYSPFGMIDVVFGTLSTAITVFFVSRSKSLLMATIWPVVFSSMVGVIISYMLSIPLLSTIIYVMAGEFGVTVIVGYNFYEFLSKSSFLNNYLLTRNPYYGKN